MKNKELDELFRGKLEQIQPNYNPASWDSLAHMLDNTNLVEREFTNRFDNTVKENLKGYKVAYNPRHWSILSLRIDKILAFRRNLYLFKLTELALMSLLLLLLFQYLPENGPVKKEKVKQIVPTET